MKHLFLALFGMSFLSACVASVPEPETDEEAFGEDLDAEDLKEDGVTHGIRLPDTGPFGNGLVLTFDDGPDKGNGTEDVIDVLEQFEAPAVFFIVGKNVMINDTTILSAAHVLFEQWYGHHRYEMAIHSWDHVNQKTLSNASVKRGTNRTELVLQNVHDELDRAVARARLTATGALLWNDVVDEIDLQRIRDDWKAFLKLKEAAWPSIKYRCRYYRFPGGDANARVLGVVKGLGYHAVGWHGGVKDYRYKNRLAPSGRKWTLTEYVDGVTKSVKSSAGGVVLKHDRVYDVDYGPLDGGAHVSRLLPILTEYQARGYSFIRLDSHLFAKMNEGNISEACTVDSDCAGGASCDAGSKSCTRACTTFCSGSGDVCVRTNEQPATTTVGHCAANPVYQDQDCPLGSVAGELFEVTALGANLAQVPACIPDDATL